MDQAAVVGGVFLVFGAVAPDFLGVDKNSTYFTQKQMGLYRMDGQPLSAE